MKTASAPESLPTFYDCEDEENECKFPQYLLVLSIYLILKLIV